MLYKHRDEKSEELSINNTYFTEMPTPGLAVARKAMGIVSGDLYTEIKKLHIGGGVVVRSKGKKYLVTASHSTGPTAYKRPSNHKFYWQDMEMPLRYLHMIYSTPIAEDPKSKLPIADVAIFEFPFDFIQSVELSKDLPKDPKVTVSLGFPVDAIDLWLDNRLPVGRSGLSYLSRRTQIDFEPYEDLDLSRCVPEITADLLTAGGSSGGGLFDKDGNLLAICRGYKTIDKTWGEFQTVNTIFEALNL
ncbi:MAG: trypsin-like peptidase domain-containing protein [Candidatus Aenigmarchaeota archaeon]|nr:trypsin-like peptidase domain-containing protein [Candidatus Aenigmarchaeota archaeon]